MILLTVVNDIDGGTRSENSEGAGIIEAGGMCGTVRYLEAGTGNISTCVFRETRRVIYLGTVERGARSSGVYDAEAVFGEGAQDSTRIIKEFEGLIAGVDNGRGDLQVLQSVDLDLGGRGLDSQTGSSIDGNCRSDEGDESGTER